MKRPNKTKYLIIGAGPTGLGAAYRLKELGQSDFAVLERSSHAGGLAASFQDEKGFTWDIGGHVQFSHYKYFDDLMVKALGAEGWLTHERESWAWMCDRFIPYPVQNNIRHLPRDLLWKCIEGVIDCNLKQSSEPPANFKEWILATFGQGFADLFMLPYNFKVWAFPPEDLAYHWIGERVAVTDIKRTLKNVILEKDDLSWGPNNTFQFPKRGGTGAIWNSVANLVGSDRIFLNSGVQSIHPESKTVVLGSGEKMEYDFLLSTMPLDLLTRMVQPELTDSVLELSTHLVHSTSNIVGLGLKGPTPDSLKTKCWMYFPESNCPFYRATVFSNYSPNNVPDISKYWSLMTETSESSKKPVDRKQLVEDTIQGCINTRLISSRSDVVSTWVYSAEHGYPTPSLKRDHVIRELIPFFEQKGIFSRGRFGAWKYEVSNQDHSLMQGVEWASRMVLNEPEVTWVNPNFVNAQKR
ncbi:FAD-dependent oxidoreductase [bacterium]|nr:FAD-dependent oxidoreductase [bacterium]